MGNLIIWALGAVLLVVGLAAVTWKLHSDTYRNRSTCKRPADVRAIWDKVDAGELTFSEAERQLDKLSSGSVSCRGISRRKGSAA